jgi:hypothetical protein
MARERPELAGLKFVVQLVPVPREQTDIESTIGPAWPVRDEPPGRHPKEHAPSKAAGKIFALINKYSSREK